MTSPSSNHTLAWGDPQAKVVICLHGFPDVAEGWEPFARIVQAGGWRVVAPYLRGYAPATLQGPHTLEQLAADLIALAAELAPDGKVAVVGHDWGALATYLACALAPERFERCVTLAVPHPNAFLTGVPRDPFQLVRSWYMLLFQLPLAAEWALRRRDFALVLRLWRDWSPGWEPPPEHLARVKRCLEASLPAPIEYYREMFRGVVAGKRFPEGRLAVPTLFLHGERDGCVGAALAEGQERYFAADFRAEVLPDVGHFLHLERPALVAERVLGWLAS